MQFGLLIVSNEDSDPPPRQRRGRGSVSVRSLSDESSTSSWVHVPPSSEDQYSSQAPIRSSAPVQRNGEARPTGSRYVARPSSFDDHGIRQSSSYSYSLPNRPLSPDFISQDGAGERDSAAPIIQYPGHFYDTHALDNHYDFYDHQPMPVVRGHEEDRLSPVPSQRTGLGQRSSSTRRIGLPPSTETSLSGSQYYRNPPVPSYSTTDRPSSSIVMRQNAPEEVDSPYSYIYHPYRREAVRTSPQKLSASANQGSAPIIPQLDEKSIMFGDRTPQNLIRPKMRKTLERPKPESSFSATSNNTPMSNFDPSVSTIRPPQIVASPTRPIWWSFVFNRNGASWREDPIIEQGIMSESEIEEIFRPTSVSMPLRFQLRNMGPNRQFQIEKHTKLLDSMESDGSSWAPVWINNIKTKLSGQTIAVLVFQIIYSRGDPERSRYNREYSWTSPPISRTSKEIEPELETDKVVKKKKKKKNKERTHDEKMKKPCTRALMDSLSDASKSSISSFILPTASQRSINDDLAKKMTQLEHRILSEYEILTSC